MARGAAAGLGFLEGEGAVWHGLQQGVRGFDFGAFGVGLGDELGLALKATDTPDEEGILLSLIHI